MKQGGGKTMQKTLLVAALTIGLLSIPLLVHAEVYKWIDDKGDVHFTDDYSNIPEKYRPAAEHQRSPEETSPARVEKKPTPALAPKVSEPPAQKKPETQKTPSVVPEVFEGVIRKLDDFGRSFVATGEKGTISFPISGDTRIIDELGKEVPFEDLERRMSVTASGIPVLVKYMRDGDDIHTSTITIRAQKEFNGRDYRRPRPPLK
jgi:Domain of unknown function (DUF4124)